MAGPDALVQRAGETVELEIVTDYELDQNGQVDPNSVETAREEIKAIVSQPTEEDEHRLEGRLEAGSIKLTVPSDTDVAVTRGGRRDLLWRPGRKGYGYSYNEEYGGDPEAEAYEVVEVNDDQNPLTGTRKLTVFANRYGGR